MDDVPMEDAPITDIAPIAPIADPGRLAQVTSFAIIGIEARSVCVEVSVRNGYPRVAMVGSPDKSARESQERVEEAIKQSLLPFPDRRITINLAPAELPKEGARFDLPIALGVLAANGTIPAERLADWVIAGELRMDGTVHATRGILAMALGVRSLSGRPRRLMVPLENAVEARTVEGVDVSPVSTLREAVDTIRGHPPNHPDPRPREVTAAVGADLSEVRGQAIPRRALEIAVAGGHNILLIGSPGSGKTLLAERVVGILPPMSPQESLETTLVFSAAGKIKEGCGLIEARPYRAPHQSISPVGMIGGGHGPTPGEVSLAHNGVLFLDEMAQFPPSILDLMRQPLEDGRVTIVRINGVATFPARFMLVGAMNPCPCGFLGDSMKSCRCTPTRLRQYRSRLSGPLLDRIDLHIEVPRVPLDALASDVEGEPSANVRRRVVAAREIQTKRFADQSGIHCNAQMRLAQLRAFARPDARGTVMLKMAAERLGLTGRAYHRIVRVARTIADLDGATTVGEKHIAEAIGYRAMDRDASDG
jgi:magnesium chelatase family protein